jgi:hypothetical protein
MQIIAHTPLQSGKERKKIFRASLEQRAHEWQRLTGFRRSFVRLKIWFWAWYETDRKMAGKI